MNAEIHDPRYVDVIGEQVEFETLGTGFAFTEGSLWQPVEKSLISHLSDMLGDQTHFWTARHRVRTFRRPSNMANGNAFDRQRRLIHL